MQLGDAVHPVEQHPVVTDHEERSGESVESPVQTATGVDVEVVGRLVEQQDVGSSK